MNLRAFYLVAAVLGAVGPCVFFAMYFADASTGLPDFVKALFANGASGGFTVDLLISSFVFWALLITESRRLNLPRPWLYIVLNLCIGLSLALPLFLFFRQKAIESSAV